MKGASGIVGALHPLLEPQPDPPQRGGSKRLDSGDLRSPDPRPGAEPLDPKTKGRSLFSKDAYPMSWGFKGVKPLCWGVGTFGPHILIHTPSPLGEGWGGVVIVGTQCPPP